MCITITDKQDATYYINPDFSFYKFNITDIEIKQRTN